MKRPALTSPLTDWLVELGVPVTASYCDKRFHSMPFHTLFGLKKLLEEFGVDSTAVEMADKAGLERLPLPCLTLTQGNNAVIMTALTPDSVEYVASGRRRTMARKEFEKSWTGVAMIAYPDEKSKEPSFTFHHNVELANKAKRYVLAMLAAVMLSYFFVTRGLYDSWSTIGLAAIDIAGIYISILLVRHQLGYEDKAAKRVCAALQPGGCDTVLSTSASKFFGLFGWSEVGLSYFAVTFATMLLFPQHMGCLALINLCALPFSFWSVWYQRFRAKAWCTMCLTIQAMLWLQFGCYLGGGWYSRILPLSPAIAVLIAVYGCALLGLNAVMPMAEKHK
ncbi:MAG: hypothetical protein HDS92_04585 [Bacteroidales bacterium]|nr:hypothetical protein [Bacteroidales bacterium]